jgi:hypothetical protein
VYVGAIGIDRLGSYLVVVPVLAAAVLIWAGALWIAGPRRQKTLGSRAGR